MSMSLSSIHPKSPEELRAEVEAEDRQKAEKAKRKAEEAHRKEMKRLAAKYEIWKTWLAYDLEEGLKELMRRTTTDKTEGVAVHIRETIDKMPDGKATGWTNTLRYSSSEVDWYVKSLVATIETKNRDGNKRRDYLFGYKELAKSYKATGYGLWTTSKGYIITLWPTVPNYCNWDYDHESFEASLEALGFTADVTTRLIQGRTNDLTQRQRAQLEYEERERKRMRNDCAIM